MAGSNCRPMVYDTIALPTELTKHGRMFYTGYHPAIRVANPFFQYHSVATPMDSALYPLRCFPVSFATDTGTLEYSQAQHLFAYSFYRLSIGNSDSGPHVDHAHQFNVVVYGDCDVGQHIFMFVALR